MVHLDNGPGSGGCDTDLIDESPFRTRPDPLASPVQRPQIPKRHFVLARIEHIDVGRPQGVQEPRQRKEVNPSFFIYSKQRFGEP